MLQSWWHFCILITTDALFPMFVACWYSYCTISDKSLEKFSVRLMLVLAVSHTSVWPCEAQTQALGIEERQDVGLEASWPRKAGSSTEQCQTICWLQWQVDYIRSDLLVFNGAGKAKCLLWTGQHFCLICWETDILYSIQKLYKSTQL